MAKNPVFPLYYNDIDRSTRDWSDEEFGAYMRLLMHQWDKGGLPNDYQRLTRIATSLSTTWEMLKDKFPESDGLLKNKVLEDIRDKYMKHKQKQKENVEKRYQSSYQNDTKKLPLEDEREITVYPNTLLGKMISVFKSHYPFYPIDEKEDMTACLSIAHKIAKEKKWSKDSVMNGNMQGVLESWDKIVLFSTGDKWYSTRSISDFNREFQRVTQSMVSVKNKQPANKEQQQIPSAPTLTILKPS